MSAISHNYSGCAVLDPDFNGSQQHNTGNKDLAEVVWVILGPLILTIGLFGNLLILVLMNRRFLCGTTTSVYLRTMAAADICALISGIIPEVLEAANIIVIKESHPVACKLEKFIFYTSADTSMWILVIFTIDRFLAVCFPLTFRSTSSLFRARAAATGAFVIAICKSLHVFWTRGAEYHVLDGVDELLLVSNCGHPTLAFKHFECLVRPWIVFVVVDAGPFVFILTSNVFIVLEIRKLVNDETFLSSNNSRQLVQLSLMCLSASFCFLICITPSIVLLIGRPHWTQPHLISGYTTAKAFNNVLVYVHHSANFFLYCITGKRFRAALWALFHGEMSGNVDETGVFPIA
ncbi:hypothetical protein CAPTEDRAFT_185632 [Capitella teleta]|uniref:G-protein coupled receptors family 1 profile domain-containing protein n=1 Tax=Capitella teleta TaxID=283909 RepID=R7UC53_CAPTE|nr:hypothetical protein CAPTEDRAFT_185632 [Capitella teleta]|eukprot:ELU03569.1 hypothetical protein CAPTEDRAFT_185632 [Capitella teleta]